MLHRIPDEMWRAVLSYLALLDPILSGSKFALFLDGGAPVKPAAFMLVIGLPLPSPVNAVPGAGVVGAFIMELLAYPAALYSGLPVIEAVA